MIENIPLTVYAGNRAVVVPAGIIHTVVNDISPIGVGTCGAVGGGIGKAAALLGGVDHIINAVDLTWRVGFIEKGLLFRKFPLFGPDAGNKMLNAALSIYDICKR